MKKFVAIAAFVGLASAAFGQSAPANQIDIGAGYYGTDITGVYKDALNSATTGQSNKYGPSLNWNGKYTYTFKADDANTLKFALADDGYYGIYDGRAAQGYGAGQNAGKVTPSVEWLGFGADVTLGLPIYYGLDANASGLNELKYAYKEVAYMTIGNSSGTTGTDPFKDNSVIAVTSVSAFYKYSFDKTTWVSGGVLGLVQINPAVYPIAVLPKVSGGAYGAQLDVQFDDYNSPGNQNGSTGDKKKAYADLYLEPKLTYDFGFPGWVSGLKGYFQSRIGLSTTNPKWDSTNNGGTTQKFHDTYIQPGLNYTYPVPGIGSFNLDAGWRFNKVNSVASFKSDGKTVTGTSSDTSQDVPPYSELRLALTYTYKF